MKKRTDGADLLDLMVGPCFCAKDNRIIRVNQDASRLFLTEGMEVTPLLSTGAEDYADFREGCLYLELKIGNQAMGAAVTRMDGADYFVLDQEIESAELQILSLAAQELREPLSAILLCTEQMEETAAQDQEARLRLARLKKGLAQMHRMVGNMSDACGRSSRQELQDMGALFREIFEKAQTLTEKAGIPLTYEGLDETIYSLADSQELERAALNLVANALKFLPRNGSVQASLTRKEHMLYLRIQDNGSGIPDEIRSTVYRRFLRIPGIEDSHHGIGLGMVLVRNAAAHHGGTVLIDRPETQGTRVTLTLPIRQNSTSLRSPIMRIDYAGGTDHTLIELSDSLPPELYL